MYVVMHLMLGPDDVPNAEKWSRQVAEPAFDWDPLRLQSQWAWFRSGQQSLGVLLQTSTVWRDLLLADDSNAAFLSLMWERLAESVFGCRLDEDLVYVGLHLRMLGSLNLINEPGLDRSGAIARRALLTFQESCHSCARCMVEPDLFAMWPFGFGFPIDDHVPGFETSAPSSYLCFPCCRSCFWSRNSSVACGGRLRGNGLGIEWSPEEAWLSSLVELATAWIDGIRTEDIPTANSTALALCNDMEMGMTWCKAQRELYRWMRWTLLRIPRERTAMVIKHLDSKTLSGSVMQAHLERWFEQHAISCRIVSDSIPGGDAEPVLPHVRLVSRRALMQRASALLYNIIVDSLR